MRLLCILVLLTGCAYHFIDEPEGGRELKTISVPYIKGDAEGLLGRMLVRALTASGSFECVQTEGEWILEVSLLADNDERIGYRYDRDPTTGKRRTNIVGTENRNTIIAEMKLIDSYTQELVIESHALQGISEYDYVDSNSIRDLTFTNSQGVTETVLDFSLGQLDSIEGAHDDAARTSYESLVLQIINSLLNSL